MLLIFTLPTVFHPVFRNGSNFAKLTMVFTGGSSGRFFFFFWGGGGKSLKKKVIWNDCFAAMGDDFHLRTTDALSNKFLPSY